MTSRGIQPTTDVSRYLIITSPTNNKNNVLYYLSTHEIGFIIIFGKKRQEFCWKLTAQDVWGQKFRDKYHEEKRRETKGIFLCLSACVTHSEAKILLSETPGSTSPWDLDGVFAIFYVKNEWNKRPRLKKAKPREYIKLISRYEAILNGKSNATSKISNMELVELGQSY